MIGPKSAHLVERAAERLLQAGVLEGSAAQLLEPGRARAPVDDTSRQAAAVAAGSSTQPSPLSNSHGDDVLIAEPPGRDVAEAREDMRRLERPIVDLATLERAGLFDWTRGRSRISEEFRLAQRQVAAHGIRPHCRGRPFQLCVYGDQRQRPGEGKSFTALNLACSVALQGDHHALLIDSDSKRDSVCQALGLGDAPGILDLASDPSLDAAKLILRTEIEHLSILPVGQERGRSPELFASREMTQLVQRLGRRYSDQAGSSSTRHLACPPAIPPRWRRSLGRSCSSSKPKGRSVTRWRPLLT